MSQISVPMAPMHNTNSGSHSSGEPSLWPVRRMRVIVVSVGCVRISRPIRVRVAVGVMAVGVGEIKGRRLVMARQWPAVPADPRTP